jgi:hypothetical protein
MTIVRAATSSIARVADRQRQVAVVRAGGVAAVDVQEAETRARARVAHVCGWPAWQMNDGAVSPIRGSAIPPQGNELSDGTIAERMPPTGVLGKMKIIVAILATSSDQLSPDLRLSVMLSVNDSGGLTVKPPSRNGWAWPARRGR